MRSLGLTMLLCAAGAFPLEVDKPVPPPRPQDLPGSWVGYEDDGLRFARLELGADGHGLLCLAYLDDAPELYLVKAWSAERFEVRFDLMAIDLGATPILLAGKTDSHRMELEISEAGRHWKRQLNLFNEREFLSKSRRTQDRIENYRKEEKRKPPK